MEASFSGTVNNDFWYVLERKEKKSRNVFDSSLWIFQSTHPYTGCDTPARRWNIAFCIFQSTHPYTGCDRKI